MKILKGLTAISNEESDIPIDLPSLCFEHKIVFWKFTRNLTSFLKVAVSLKGAKLVLEGVLWHALSPPPSLNSTQDRYVVLEGYNGAAMTKNAVFRKFLRNMTSFPEMRISLKAVKLAREDVLWYFLSLP